MKEKEKTMGCREGLKGKLDVGRVPVIMSLPSSLSCADKPRPQGVYRRRDMQTCVRQ